MACPFLGLAGVSMACAIARDGRRHLRSTLTLSIHYHILRHRPKYALVCECKAAAVSDMRGLSLGMDHSYANGRDWCVYEIGDSRMQMSDPGLRTESEGVALG